MKWWHIVHEINKSILHEEKKSISWRENLEYLKSGDKNLPYAIILSKHFVWLEEIIIDKKKKTFIVTALNSKLKKKTKKKSQR